MDFKTLAVLDSNSLRFSHLTVLDYNSLVVLDSNTALTRVQAGVGSKRA